MANRNNVVVTNTIIQGSGAETASSPSVAFGDADTGFYESQDDKLHVTLGGTERFAFSGSDFVKADGTKYITTAVVQAGAIGNSELSGQILWSKLANDTQGRILYVNSASQVSGLAVGTAGQILQTNGAGQDPSWITSSSGVSGMKIRGTFQGTTTEDDVFVTLGMVQINANDIQQNGMIYVQFINSDLGAGTRGSHNVSYETNSISGSVTHDRSTIDIQDGVSWTIVGQDPVANDQAWLQAGEPASVTLSTTGAVDYNVANVITTSAKLYIKHRADSTGTKRTTANVYW